MDDTNREEETHLIQHHNPHNIPHDERERILGRHTKVFPVDGTIHVSIPANNSIHNNPQQTNAVRGDVIYSLL